MTTYGTYRICFIWVGSGYKSFHKFKIRTGFALSLMEQNCAMVVVVVEKLYFVNFLDIIRIAI